MGFWSVLITIAGTFGLDYFFTPAPSTAITVDQIKVDNVTENATRAEMWPNTYFYLAGGVVVLLEVGINERK